ncbi:MAG: Fe-S cluster assembly sulfur transfer protein SufU [Acidobacteriota bacterium]
MSDLRQLYQEIILDHYRSPRNFGPLEDANHDACGHNPLCGDRVQVFLKVEDGKVHDIAFEGAGCAISTASASLMSEAVKGKDVDEARDLFERFHDMVTGVEDVGEHDLGKLEALAGVRDLPVRIKCATLAWHTFRAALEQNPESISTE